MSYLIILLCSVLSLAEGLIKKTYTYKTEKTATSFYTASVCFAALIFFIINNGGIGKFPLGVVWYSIFFGIAYGICTFSMLIAIKCGSLPMTSLVSSCSVSIPTIYGLIFLNEKVSITLVIGLIMLFSSIVIVNLKPHEKAIRITPKWLICVIIGFIGNGMCSTLQRMQQIVYDGAYKNELMIVAMAFLTIVFLITSIYTDKGTDRFRSFKFAFPAGILNGTMNYFVMVSVGLVSASVFYPALSGLGMFFSFINSIIFFKEKFSTVQTMGYILGLASVVIINL